MTKRVAVVTGSNKGIGFAIVKILASKFDGDVLLTARSEERGREALKKVHDCGLTNVLFHQLDIDDKDSIQRLAEYLKSHYGGLDVLVNNAAIAFPFSSTEPFGHQAKVTIHTNYFSVKQTCDILFPLLRDGSRVVNVSSAAGFLPRINGDEPAASQLRAKFASSDSTLTYDELDNMIKDFVALAKAGDHQAKGWPHDAYVVSKVGLSALTRIQHRELMKNKDLHDVVINHVHPGYVGTDMTRYLGPLTIEEGAQSSVFAATLPKGTEINGQYIWKDCSVVDWVNGPTPSKN